MKMSEFVKIIDQNLSINPTVKFVGIKWQEEHHPSAELFPIEFVDAKAESGGRVIVVKFVTTKHNQ